MSDELNDLMNGRPCQRRLITHYSSLITVLLPARLALVAAAIAAAAVAAAVTITTAATAAITATAAAPISTRLGFVDRQIAAAKVFAVKLLDSRRRFFRSCHFHKCKTA